MARPHSKRIVNLSEDESRKKHNTAISEALFSSIGEGAIVTDGHGNISRINQVASDILGYKSKELIGKWFPGTIAMEDQKGNIIPNIERPITEAFLKGKPIFRKVFYRKKNGGRVAVALTVSPIILKKKPVGAIGVFRDITEELELDNSKDEFISIASHQLRTPATIVKQYIGMILEGYSGKLTTAQTAMLKIAYENNEYQINTINDLLKVAQADANALSLVHTKINLISLLGAIIREQKRKYKQKELTLDFIHSQPKVWAMVDALHLRMVFDNLLDNAYKYSYDNKKVIVKITVSDPHVIVEIKDQGVGIDEKDMHKLFMKFSRIANPLSFAGGTGLGLYWASKLIELHKGTLSVKSNINKGTTFTIKIPSGLDD